MRPRVVSLEPVGRYADGSPRYAFATGLPSRGVRELPEPFSTAEEAGAHGRAVVIKYRQDAFPGGMGEVIGVTERFRQFRVVINVYYSNS